jgi:4-aminobutyrate aminotransferase
MDAIELVRDRQTREPANPERNAILNAAFRHGLTLLPAGESVIRFCPPLIIQKDDIDTGMEILDQALEAGSPAIPGRG